MIIETDQLLGDLIERFFELSEMADCAEFEGYKHMADKYKAQEIGLQYAISLIESGEYDIKEPAK
tara:strand:+ start:27292 stop:27486 length:195 start_codon:yes stop_codon:yes gene_type:complete